MPDTGATQEVAVDYAAVSAEQPFGGLRIDIIPREGGNTFRGTVFATGVNSAWQGSNLTEELRNRGLPEPNEMKQAYDINPSVGGPIMRDKLWFYSSARWQKNQNYIAGLYDNKNAGDPTKWLYEQDRSQRGFFSLEQNGVNTRLTWQAAQKHKLAVYYDNQARIWDDTPRRRVARIGSGLPVPGAQPGAGELDVPVDQQAARRGPLRASRRGVRQSTARKRDRSIATWSRSSSSRPISSTAARAATAVSAALFGYSSQKINTAVASMSYVTGAHAFKVGFSDTWASTRSIVESNSSLHDVPLQQRHPEPAHDVRRADAAASRS